MRHDCIQGQASTWQPVLLFKEVCVKLNQRIEKRKGPLLAVCVQQQWA